MRHRLSCLCQDQQQLHLCSPSLHTPDCVGEPLSLRLFGLFAVTPALAHLSVHCLCLRKCLICHLLLSHLSLAATADHLLLLTVQSCMHCKLLLPQLLMHALE